MQTSAPTRHERETKTNLEQGIYSKHPASRLTEIHGTILARRAGERVAM